MSISRPRILFAAGLALALLVAAAVSASSQTVGPVAPQFDPSSPRFTLAVIPDTQYLFDDDRGDSEPVTAALDWMVANRASENIAFAAGLGDVTQDGLPNEIDRASDAFGILDRAKLPYSVLAGNHDIDSSTDDTRPPSPFSNAFGPQRYANDPTFIGASPGGYDTAHLFTAGGRQWLVLALDWRIGAAGTAWAQSVLDAHKTVPTIVTTHETLSSDAAGSASLTSYGQTLWNTLIRSDDQIILALSGHNWPVGRTTLKNDFGHDVSLNLADYQDMYYGGAGMIRTYAFDLDRDTIDVSTFSPWIEAKPEADRNVHERQMVERTDAASRFSIPVDFAALAQRLDPKPAPAEVATDALKIPGTLALWRPSGSGAVTRLADLSGNGNDLTPVTLAGSTGAQAAVTVNDDHGLDQPSAKSLLFTANKNARRGTYLQTAAGAPLNTSELKGGYTIEAFVKLPANCCNSNAWMGILGQQGTGRDLGRTSNDPDEGSIELALSGGAELQWAVWPTNRPDNTTAWGHLMATQTWTHVAVVNDGRFTDLYIDGSLMGRNPLSPAIGLGTTGRPWMLGAIDYADVVEQTFNGLMGDVRIVDHALAPSQFMDAARAPQPGARATRAELSTSERAIAVTFTAGHAVGGSAAVQVVEPHTGARFDLGERPFAAAAGGTPVRYDVTADEYRALQDGARVEVAIDGAEHDILHLRAGAKGDVPVTSVSAPATAGGDVPATLGLTLGAPASLGAFTPGADRTYTASTTAGVISTAGDATLSVSDPGRLRNGAFSLADPLQVSLSRTTWSAPVSNDPVTVALSQHVGADEALRTGAYSTTLQFTLATTTP